MMEENLHENLHEKFIEKLVEKYGAWEKVTSKFGNSSFGEIADELCISTSQFSKLISGTATEGMYLRSIKNLDQLMQFELYKTENERLKRQQENLETKVGSGSNGNGFSWKKILFISMFALVTGSVLTKLIGDRLGNNTVLNAESPYRSHPLTNFFDRHYQADFNSPFLKETEVQSYCPCSGYEGVWALDKEYKFPLPGSRKPGVYYLAKSADIRMKCVKSAKGNERGQRLMGFENLHHEIWVDRNKTPFSPKYFEETTKTYTQDFLNLEFEDNPQFTKVADIYSFFIDEFMIYPDSITRKGEPCGRYANVVDRHLVDEFEIDLKDILNNTIGNLTTTNCQPAINPFCDPNDLQESKSVIDFNCLFTIKTENLGIGGGYPYKKGYKLVKQNYSDNLLCNCSQSNEQ